MDGQAAAAQAAAADLAVNVAAHAGLMAALRSKGPTPRIGESDDDVNGNIRAAGMTPLITSCLQANAADVALLLTFRADPTVEGDVLEKMLPHAGTKEVESIPTLYCSTRR